MNDKIVFNVSKNNEPINQKRKTKKNYKREKYKKFLVEKIEEKRNNDIAHKNNDNENQAINLSDENYTIELIDEEENIINNDNDISSFRNEIKQNYPHYYNKLSPSINLSKYIN